MHDRLVGDKSIAERLKVQFEENLVDVNDIINVIDDTVLDDDVGFAAVSQ